MTTPTYSVATWHPIYGRWSPQRGLSVPSFNITRGQLRQALKELSGMGYEVGRLRCPDGDHESQAPFVLVERTDGKHWKGIMKGWKR